MGKGGSRSGGTATRAVERGMTFREAVDRDGLRGLVVEPDLGTRDLEARLAAWEAASAGGRRKPQWSLGLRGCGAAEVVEEAARLGRVVVLEDDPRVESRVVLFADHAVRMELTHTLGRKATGRVTWMEWLMPTRDVEEGITIGAFLAKIGKRHFSRAGNPDEPLTSDAGRAPLMEAMADVAAWVGVAPGGTNALWLVGGVAGDAGEGGRSADYRFGGNGDVEVTGLPGKVMETLVAALNPRGWKWVHILEGWDNERASWYRASAWESFPMDRSPGSATLRRAALAGMRDRRAAAAARVAARIEAWDPGVAEQVRRSVP